MTDQNQVKQEKGNKAVNPVAVAAAGAIVGASVAVAGAVALRNGENRDKVKQVLRNAKDQAMAYMGSAQKQMNGKKVGVEDKLAVGKEKAKKIAHSAKNSLQSEAKDAKKVLAESK